MRHCNDRAESAEEDMTTNHGHFMWYELLTTDTASAEGFYHQVLGWDARDASTRDFAYRLLSAGTGPVSGLMALPPEARASGATPRWVGYVAVDDVDAVVDRLKGLGGSVYVPPTDSNIGRVSIVADPQSATLGLVQGLSIALPTPAGGSIGRVGWHELLAADWRQAFPFYSALFGWRPAGDDAGPIDGYQLFAAGADTHGGMFTKLPRAPFPFWLYYFDVPDTRVALQLVRAHGGRVVQGPVQLPDGTWIARCIDPQGAMFALQGKSSGDRSDQAALEIGWSAEWGGFASRGRLVSAPAATKPAAPSSQQKAKTTSAKAAPAKKPSPPRR
jgi:predicted enzyme related to lactoylglutathione lyase